MCGYTVITNPTMIKRNINEKLEWLEEKAKTTAVHTGQAVPVDIRRPSNRHHMGQPVKKTGCHTGNATWEDT